MNKIELNVNPKLGKTVYKCLKNIGLSNTFIKNLKKEPGNILLNGIPVFTNKIIEKRSKLTLLQKEQSTNMIIPQIGTLNILYEDEYLLIVNKPAGIPTIPSKGHLTDTLANFVIGYLLPKKPDFNFRALGRLDKNTSGAVIICKNLFIYNTMLNKGKVHKTYLALVKGQIKPRIIKDKILTEKSNEGINIQKRIISNSGKDATTIIKKSSYDKISDSSLLYINILTGRTHQIRLHLSNIGHSVIGDDLYGNSPAPRMYLHCYKVSFIHPITNKRLILTSQV